MKPTVLGYQRRSTSRAELGVCFGPRPAILANSRVAGPHRRECLGGVAGFERVVIGVRDLSGLPIELQLAESVDGGTFRISGRHWKRNGSWLSAVKRIQHVAKRSHRENGPDQERAHRSRLTAASSAASSLSDASTRSTATGSAAGARDFHRLISPVTTSAPAPSAKNGIV